MHTVRCPQSPAQRLNIFGRRRCWQRQSCQCFRPFRHGAKVPRGIICPAQLPPGACSAEICANMTENLSVSYQRPPIPCRKVTWARSKQVAAACAAATAGTAVRKVNLTLERSCAILGKRYATHESTRTGVTTAVTAPQVVVTAVILHIA